jgi:hypothetical protein
MNEIDECLFGWVSRYRSSGLAVAAIRPGEKVPGYRGWTQRSLEPQDFRPGDQVGLMPGGLSGDLVCVDLDSQDAVARADEFLPPTAMIEGRPGKPRSHRYRRNSPPGRTWPAGSAGRGPGTTPAGAST